MDTGRGHCMEVIVVNSVPCWQMSSDAAAAPRGAVSTAVGRHTQLQRAARADNTQHACPTQHMGRSHNFYRAPLIIPSPAFRLERFRNEELGSVDDGHA